MKSYPCRKEVRGGRMSEISFHAARIAKVRTFQGASIRKPSRVTS
jgi:hypothetical protein